MGGVDWRTESDFLDKRFRLFDAYTFPSMMQQTNKNFIWLVLFSATTPEQYNEKIKKYSEIMPNFVPLYVDERVNQSYKEVLSDYMKWKEGDWLVTTRCDNDDILNKHFVEIIQENITFDREYIITFPNGYQYDERTMILRKYYFPENHFTTLVTDTDKTIYNIRHMQIYEQSVVKAIKREPLWIEVIHEGNVYNRMGGLKFSEYVQQYDLTDNFSVDLKHKNSKAYLFVMYVFFAVRKLYVKRNKIKDFVKVSVKRLKRK